MLSVLRIVSLPEILVFSSVIVLGACGKRADMAICQPMPTAEQASVHAYLNANSDPRVVSARAADRTPPGQLTLAGAKELSEVEAEVIDRCLTRNAYNLAKDTAELNQTAESVFSLCSDVIREDIKKPMNLKAQTVDERALAWNARIRARVIEARAGECWEQ